MTYKEQLENCILATVKTTEIMARLERESLKQRIKEAEKNTDYVVEEDIVVSMPPKREYRTKLTITKVEKGKPVIVLPELWAKIY